MVFFVDDLNLPEAESYGTQSALALMRQHLDYNHWYDMQKLTVKQVIDTQYLAAMNPLVGSSQVNARLQRHFTTFAVYLPLATSLQTIFQTYLDGHLNNQDFDGAMVSTSPNIIKGALAVHKEVSETFRMSVANFHYHFNLRHLTDLFRGIILSLPTNIRNPESMALLWAHETDRVYGDRIATIEDVETFRAIVSKHAKQVFPQYNLQKHFPTSGIPPEPLMFCHFADGLDDDSGYGHVLESEKMHDIVENALSMYNESNLMMDLVLFDEAIGHILRITRVIKQSGGHVLLVGLGGSGKQSLARLAATMCRYGLVQNGTARTYSLVDLKADLQNLYFRAGVKSEGVVFLLNGSEIPNDKFLVYFSELMASGRITNLYTKEEQDAVIGAMITKARAKGLSTEPAFCWEQFLSQVRQNLHLIICFSPSGSKLREVARRFPALINFTVMDWFLPWPKQALIKVAKTLLSSLELGELRTRSGIENFMAFSYESADSLCKKYHSTDGRYVYVTLKSYVESLKLYGGLLRSKTADVESGIARLSDGVEKLNKASETVMVLERDLAKMTETAEEKRKVADKMAALVLTEKVAVQAENDKVSVEASKVALIEEDVKTKMTDAEADLLAAEPIVAAAVAALDTLDRKELGMCKTMAKPPPGVADIFSAVLVLLAGVNPNIVVGKNGKVKDKDRSWDAIKKALLGNINGFVDDLRTIKGRIDEASISDINFKEVRPYFQLEHFHVESIEKRNSAAAGLCSWVINMVKYYDIVLVIEPKHQLLREAQKQLEIANKQLSVAQAKANEMKERLDKMLSAKEIADQEMKDARHEAEMGKLRLELAARLVESLGSERARWSDSANNLQAEKDVLVGDVLLASAFVSYVGPFTRAYREELVKDTWVPYLYKAASGQPIPMTSNLDPLKVLAHEADIAAWNNQSLPSDIVSTQNAAVITTAARWPLLVDPHMQGLMWVMTKETERSKNIQVVRLDQPDYLRKIEVSIENGYATVIQEMGEQIDSVLFPIISRKVVTKGVKTFARVGGSEIEVHPNFLLYLHTKLSNPHYPPEIQGEVTLVNFAVTPEGLEDQLLSIIVRRERVELASKYAALIHQRNRFKVKCKELEDDILMRLSTAEGDVTEDRALIEAVEAGKKSEDEVKSKMEQGLATTQVITRMSERYRPVARRASLMFFIMNDLSRIHTHYVYSLFAFVAFLCYGIDRAKGKPSSAGAASAPSGAATTKRRGPQRPSKAGLAILPPDAGDVRFSWDPGMLKPFPLGSEADVKKLLEAEIPASMDLSDDEMDKRCSELKDSLTYTLLNYVREGLLERDRLTVLTLITLQILVVSVR